MEPKPKTKLAKDLQPGDKIELVTGKIVKVLSVSRGMARGTVLIQHGPFSNDWSAPDLYDEIVIHN